MSDPKDDPQRDERGLDLDSETVEDLDLDASTERAVVGGYPQPCTGAKTGC